MGPPEAIRFADQWIEAWNARDVEGVLAHYADDVVFTSQVASRVVPESGGVIRGKEALRQYWNLALQSNKDLHFDLVAVYVGVNTLVLTYRNESGASVNEVMTFEHGLITVGHATALRE
jgi:ketosteroid isomerase-like protein